MIIITTQAGRKLVNVVTMPISRVMCPEGSQLHRKRGQKQRTTKPAKKRHTTNIGTIKNFFKVNN